MTAAVKSNKEFFQKQTKNVFSKTIEYREYGFIAREQRNASIFFIYICIYNRKILNIYTSYVIMHYFYPISFN